MLCDACHFASFCTIGFIGIGYLVASYFRSSGLYDHLFESDSHVDWQSVVVTLFFVRS